MLSKYIFENIPKFEHYDSSFIATIYNNTAMHLNTNVVSEVFSAELW